MKRITFRLAFLLLTLLLGTTLQAQNEPIQNVVLSASAFNPSHNEQVNLRYTLAQAETVTIRVYDPDAGLVRTIIESMPLAPGTHETAWDGRDDEGQVVPNEAYTMTIETASGAVYDPTTFSGGVVRDITNAQFDAEAGTVVYQLPDAARVLIRLGIRSGPMLKTLVNWQPRSASAITEYWDGQDEDKLISLRAHKDFTALITSVTLPEATVIAYGNTQESYRAYKLGRAQQRPQKPQRPQGATPPGQLRPANLVPPAWVRVPHVQLTFPRLPDGGEGIPTVSDVVEVHVDVEPADREHLLQEQFEIIFFVDNIFFTEAERGYLPFNWRWELQQLPAGEHVLTVNISSFQGQVGVASRKVRVLKRP